MLLTRLADDSADTVPTRQPAMFADPRLQQCGDTDRRMIEAALDDANARLVSMAGDLKFFPDHINLQRSFAKMVNRRDELEQRLATL